ncbi:sodium:calcium antiporter [SAR86 cluster bacterium]|nr:sodium:calcium antiporter [SAR86 cluster bacterium]
MIIALLAICSGIALIWVSAEKLEKYSVHAAREFGFSPFFIGSTVIAFGTSAPEMLTTFFVSLENKGSMVIGNVIGSNVANLSLVFGSMLLIVSLKKFRIKQEVAIQKNLLILLISSLLIWLIMAIDPFNILSSLILLTSLILVISFWYKNGVSDENENDINLPKYVSLKLTLSLVFLVFAAWLITFGANQILDEFSLGELFIGYTVLAIGTSLPEIAASVSLALKGRYETVTGTLIGSNIFNGLCVLAIPGLFMNPKMSLGWSYSEWSPLLFILFIITFIFAYYIFSVSKKQRNASFLLSLLFLSSYFVSLYFAY